MMRNPATSCLDATRISATRGASTRTSRARIVSPSMTSSCFAMPPNRVALPPARISADRESLEEDFDVILRGRRDLGAAVRQIHRDLGAHAKLARRVEAWPDGEAGAWGHDPR